MKCNVAMGKRWLSLLLAASLLLGNVPFDSFAEETVATESAVTEETLLPTEETEETAEPTAEPTEETTEPTAEPTEETTESTAEPTEETTEPTEESTEPTAEPTEESVEPTEPALSLVSEPEESLPGKAIPLGDFAVAAVGTKALSSSAVQLSQKTLIAVPYLGASLTVFVRDGYQACVYSGNNSNKINQNSGWLGADGDGTSLYKCTLPADSIYMRLSLRRTDGAAMEEADLSRSGLGVSYESRSDVVADNATAVSTLQQTPHPVLIHISDIHGDVIRAQRAAQLADAVGADALLASGDLTAYDPDDWGGALFEAVGKYPNVNFLYGVGNHDAKGFSGTVYQETIYNGYFKNNPSTPNGETYFYRDVPGQKLRIISVNQQEGSVTTSRGGTCYSQAQVDWLVNALRTTPAGYGVVMMYHSPETAITGAEDPAYSGFFQIGNRYDTPTNSTSGYSGTLLMDLVDAFMLRESYTRSYSESNGTSPVTVNADFTGVAEGAEFIAHLTGHVHSDSITYLPGTACKQLLLGVTCTTSMYGADGGYYGLADYSDLIREADTANQDAFNAYIIDRENKTVRVLRIGAKQTVSGGIREEMTIPYSAPLEAGDYPFDTQGLVKLDLGDVEWVNYGIQEYGVEPTYKPGLRYSTNAILDVPYEGVTFYIKINAPYELGIRSGETDTTMTTNQYWLNNKQLSSGSKDGGYVCTIPSGHKKFILSMANVKRNASGNVAGSDNPIDELERQAAGLELWYKPLEEPLAGKTISILGASISTFAGTSNGAAADTTNSTIRKNVKYYPNTTIPEVTLTDTWWMQAASDLGLRLLVNNAWSGSAILLERSGTVGAYVDRCVQLHDDTGDNAGEEPDIICIQMGFNDFSYGKDTLGDANIDYDSLISPEGYGTPATTMEATAILLDKMTKRYPQAKIYMFNHFKRIGQSAADTVLMENLNASIAAVAQRYGVKVVDLYSALTDPGHIGDGKLHPNKLGMDTITEAVKTAILSDHPGERFHSVTLHRENVTADYIDHKQVASGDALDLTLTSDDPLEVTVTMGGTDITDTAYASGRVTIAAVTGDVVITARAVHVPKSYRWEFDGQELVCTEGGNSLTKNAGTTENGVFNKTRYALDTAIHLLHDQSWSVEWRSQGTFKNTSGSGARVFTSDDVNANYNARYLFKSNVDWLIAMGEKNTTGSHNYGVALSDYGIDGSEDHTYRLENRIAPDGSNMVWLLVDGVEIGPLTHYYVGTKDQGTTSDWLSGKDFVFPYMGTDTHGFTNAAIDYIQVREWDEPTRELKLCYDDHIDITGKTVEILHAGKPTSYQVGYGVEENAVPDTAVVTVEGNNLVATGIGTARVMIEDVPYRVTVTAAPISLLLLTGQSNMRGSEGNANQSIVCPEGMVYATYGDDRGADNTAMTVANARHFAPSALSGPYSSVNVEGTTDCLEGYPVYSLTEAGTGKIGPDSGYAYEWVKATGEKVWVVNAAHGGTSINVWQPGTTEYEQCQALFTACQETLRKEIAAGHFTLNHMVYFWCQGCSDRAQSAQWYVEKYLAMHEGFLEELSFDHDSNPETPNKTFEMGGITPVRVGSTAASYRDGVSPYTNSYSYHESFQDLRFSGPRAAQFWMGNNPELGDIHLVCTIGDSWVWMPDGTNGVTDYFQAHYPGGTVDYTTQVKQSAAWYTPTTPKAVHDSIHYNQIGYNEVGREAVRNALILLGEKEAPAAETTVEFLTWDGVTPAQEIKAWTTGCSGSLVVPIVSPIWKAKEVTYAVTEGLSYSYYDLLASDAQTVGTLTASTGDKVSVVKQDPGAYFAEHLSQLPESLCRGVNLWNVLEHDPQFYSSGTHWGTHSSGNVYSVTIPVKPGDKIFATAFGKAGENGHATANGIRCTFFGEYAVVKTLGPEETYAQFTANGGYLLVPEGTVAMNIPMWSNADTNELYILNLPHDRTEGICGICGKDSHVHSFGDWETLSLPSAEGPGTEIRRCSCGETENREVEGSWQKYDLAAHMEPMPERYCAGTNLWNLLEHDPMYFASGKSWGKYSGGNVCSVTIPVQPGDKIFATAFGKAGENGNASANGIRCTFFGSFDIVKTMSPEETYAEFAANGGYLIAPEGAAAINVAMWSGGSENELYLLNAEHEYEAVTDTILECGLCGSVAGGYRIASPAKEVWIDGIMHTAREDETGYYVLVGGTGARSLTVYSYNDASAADPHTQYPTAMQVWLLEFENGGYVSTYVPELENLLQYAGASIRVTGVKGIRIITGIDRALRDSLMKGTLGYTLVEYGTAVTWAADSIPVLGKGYTMSNYAYKQGVADPIFAETDNAIQFTNVLVGFTDDQLGTDLVMRPYIILEDSEGERITLYGGCVQRSIAYIAKQNQDTYPENSKADAYIEEIISKVYG